MLAGDEGFTNMHCQGNFPLFGPLAADFTIRMMIIIVCGVVVVVVFVMDCCSVVGAVSLSLLFLGVVAVVVFE